MKAIALLFMIISYIYLIIIGGIIEWSIIRESLVQFFNPFIYILVIVYMLQIPSVYIAIGIIVICYLIINKLEDKSNENFERTTDNINDNDLKVDTIFPLWSFLLATIIGFAVTIILGNFIVGFYNHPFYPFVIISYTIHPLCRYKFNYQKMSEKNNLFQRFIIICLVMNVLYQISLYGNEINSKNSNQNINTQKEYKHEEMHNTKYVANKKTLNDYYEEGSEYCTTIGIKNGEISNSPFNCIINYIENHADTEALNAYQVIEQECDEIGSYYQYKDCMYRKLGEIK